NHKTQKGTRRSCRDRTIRERDRGPGRVGNWLLTCRQWSRTATLRLPSPLTSSPSNYGSELYRQRWTRTDSGLAARNGYAGERCRHEPGTEVRRGKSQKALSEPSLFP